MNTFLADVDLTPYNTFGFAATARYFVTLHTSEEFCQTISFCREQGLPWYVLGGGSNVIFRGDYDGVIVRIGGEKISREGELVVVEGGREWPAFVEWAVENGLCGIENLAYIPGTVGASPVQNIGAYGAQVSDVIEWIEYFDTVAMQLRTIVAEECEFGYRDSIFKRELRGRAIITRVAFRLSEDFDPLRAKLDYGDLRAEVQAMEGGVTLLNIAAAVTHIRKSKLPEPSEVGNAGSFFKNPVVSESDFRRLQAQYPEIPYYASAQGVKIPAGWLIEKAGFKGVRDGAVGVHPKQALVLVHYGGGVAGDVLSLAKKIIETIAEKFGVHIDMEVNVL